MLRVALDTLAWERRGTKDLRQLASDKRSPDNSMHVSQVTSACKTGAVGRGIHAPIENRRNSESDVRNGRSSERVCVVNLVGLNVKLWHGRSRKWVRSFCGGSFQ